MQIGRAGRGSNEDNKTSASQNRWRLAGGASYLILDGLRTGTGEVGVQAQGPLLRLCRGDRPDRPLTASRQACGIASTFRLDKRSTVTTVEQKPRCAGTAGMLYTLSSCLTLLLQDSLVLSHQCYWLINYLPKPEDELTVKFECGV